MTCTIQSSQQLHEECTACIPSLQLRKLQLGRVKGLAKVTQLTNMKLCVCMGALTLTVFTFKNTERLFYLLRSSGIA